MTDISFICFQWGWCSESFRIDFRIYIMEQRPLKSLRNPLRDSYRMRQALIMPPCPMAVNLCPLSPSWQAVSIVGTMMMSQQGSQFQQNVLDFLCFFFLRVSQYSEVIKLVCISDSSQHFSFNSSGARDGIFQLFFYQYHVCWCPGSLSRQGISRHSIDSVG